MDWDKCKKEFVREVEVDESRIRSLVKTSQIRFKRAQFPFEDNYSFALEDYYESIKELLVAYLLKHGFKSSNHQCLISFFYEKTRKEFECTLIQQMSFYRNRLLYYGELVPQKFVLDNSEEFSKIVSYLVEELGK